MLEVRKADTRGRADHGWLDTRHTFSFADYYDPDFMGFGPLRVINEDRVAPGQGFGAHSHRDMEIISYVLEGALQHRDSLGNGSVMRPGDVQRMSAGTGVRHSEFNASEDELVHFLQIWILPERPGGEPGYEQKHFSEDARRDRLCLIGSRDGREESLVIQRDVDLYSSLLSEGHTLEHRPLAGRMLWVQVARGGVAANGERLEAGDGAALVDEPGIELRGLRDSEILLFDMGS
ncbi:MAG TPA: pirin family protein [Woeseiaceae bacterium]